MMIRRRLIIEGLLRRIRPQFHNQKERKMSKPLFAEINGSAWDVSPDSPETDVEFSNGSNWIAFAEALNSYYPGVLSEDFADQVAEANSSAAVAVLFGLRSESYTGAIGDPAQNVNLPETSAAPGGTKVRAFWWGFHVQFSHEDLQWVLDSADMVNNAVVAIGGSIPSPAQPFIRLIGPFVTLVHQKLRELDHGNGIYISMSWFAPGIFVPTSV
jgi:hypothetical protein